MTTPMQIGSSLQQVSSIQAPSLDQIAPNMEGTNVDFRSTVTALLKQLGSKYWMSPGLDGQISFTYRSSKLSTVLDDLCAQAGGSCQQIGDTVVMHSRGAYDHFDTDNHYYNFVPCTASSELSLTNAALFMSPKRTKGGTFDLLYEAIHLAGFKSLDLLSYGDGGFAIAFPFESVDADGSLFVVRHNARAGKKSRFRFQLPYLMRLGMPRLGELFASAYQNEDIESRKIVLAVTADAASSAKKPLVRGVGDAALSTEFRDEKWSGAPTVKVFVYEFRRPEGQHVARLLKPGESKLSAKQHLALAGLWSEKELR